MYTRFFGFKERPFKLVPNPAYLYLSRSHQEAQAHLIYAVNAGDGFVEISGEVGTGKTTLCRAFLENLEDDTESAFIFNPPLDGIQMLQSINDEFGIVSSSENSKDLIDDLNSFLIEKKAQGKNVVLVIDEAQNLSRDVLEQIRLISNLETTQDKLLQIVLVGQPELREKLNSPGLRQLNQRITLSSELTPLSRKETRAYIEHRIQIASGRPRKLFPPRAIGIIHRFSRGIPRLINLVCDRALLNAFTQDRHLVTGAIAGDAVREVAGSGPPRTKKPKRMLIGAAAVVLILVMVVFIGRFYEPLLLKIRMPPVPEPRTEPHPVPEPAAVSEPASMPPPARAPGEAVDSGRRVAVEFDSLESALARLDTGNSRVAAMLGAVALWGDEARMVPAIETMADESFFRFAAIQNGLSVFHLWNDLDTLVRLNLPAILKFRIPGVIEAGYLTLSQIRSETFLFLSGIETPERKVAANRVDIMAHWTGDAYIPWRNFLPIKGEIPGNAPGESIITLKLLLRDMGFDAVDLSPAYDRETRDAIVEIQRRHGLPDDGIVGTRTKIALYNSYSLKKELKLPHLFNPKTSSNLLIEMNTIKN